jgi:hypothetical protein
MAKKAKCRQKNNRFPQKCNYFSSRTIEHRLALVPFILMAEDRFNIILCEIVDDLVELATLHAMLSGRDTHFTSVSVVYGISLHCRGRKTAPLDEVFQARCLTVDVLAIALTP